MNNYRLLSFALSILIVIDLSTSKNNNQFNVLLTSLISDNKINSENCSNNPEEKMTTIETIRNAGYPAEEHFVESEDGYILALHRIPGPEGSRAILLYHGLTDSSFGWVVNGKDKGLAYELANNGYDVWMGNARGNVYSRRHRKLSWRNSKFWNFSFHEIGKYDLPVEIEYITSLKNDSLSFIGYSMGTTAFHIMANERQDMLSKIKTMIGLGPAVYLDHIGGIYLMTKPFIEEFEKYTDGNLPFFLQPNTYVARCVCNRPLFKEICRDIIMIIGGSVEHNINMTLIPMLMAHSPAGASVKTILHYAQIIRTKKFIQYDYGASKNMRIYNSWVPPEYDLSKVTVPVAYIYAPRDCFTAPQDVLRSWKEMPNKLELHEIEDPTFGHLDFILSPDAPKLVNSKILYFLKKYNFKN